MAWIKRNLFFVIGAVVALGLIGFAGFYNFSGWKHNSEEAEKLKASYEELKRLNSLNPHPGDGKKVDNIRLAREQQKEIRDFLAKAQRRFERIPAIPDSPRVTNEEYSSALRSTIDQLLRDAANNGVTVPSAGAAGDKKFTFSFSVQSQRVQFAHGSLEPLAVQLGEVKIIADILNKAKINSLDQFRRERVSADDQSGPQTDYLDAHSQTNELAVLSPYEVTFRCFSPELATVLSGFANSPHGLVVKSINVEPAAITVSSDQPPPVAYVPTAAPILPQPGAVRNYSSEGDAFRQRYGVQNKDAFRPVPPPVVYAQAPAAPKSGLKTVLDEKQLKVVMLIQIVKPLVKK